MGRRLLAAGTIVATLALVVVVGVPRRESVHERRQPRIDAEGVVDRISHRVVPVIGVPETLASRDDRYRATFDPSGFRVDDLGISLTAVHRGGRAVAVDLGAWRGASNVATRELTRDMTERVASRSGEVEWDVVLAAPPPGDGDLQVEATLEGLKRSPTRDGNSLRFTLTDGRVLRMGELVLMDASGRALRRALPQVDGSRLALQVPASVLDDARYPLTLDPTVSSEQAVAPDASADQRRLSVAYDYVDFLVVWQDRRSGSWDIYGARVSKSGEVLDPAGFPISTASGDQTEPEVSAIDDRFLVVWTDRRSGVDVYLSRVLSGRVIDPAGIPIATGPAVQRSPTVAQNGDGVFVAWQENGIRGARFDAARGLVLDPGGFTISSLAHSYRPTSTPSASGTLVVWARFLSRRHGREIRAARVSTHGVVLDPSSILVSRPPGVTLPSPAVSGQFVVWDEGNRTDDNIRGARISDTGTVLDPGGIDVATGTADQDSPAVAFNGNALVAWHERRRGAGYDIRGARIANDGTVLDQLGFTIADATTSERFPAVSAREDKWGVVYQRSVTNAPHGTWHAYLRTVSPK